MAEFTPMTLPLRLKSGPPEPPTVVAASSTILSFRTSPMCPEALLAAEKRTLEMIASGACLADILERLCDTIDAQAPNIKSAVMLMDADGMHLRHAAGPRVPKGWIEAITPLEIGPTVGSCGSAAF